MIRNRKIYALLTIIKYPQLKDGVSADHAQPKFVNDFYGTM